MNLNIIGKLLILDTNKGRNASFGSYDKRVSVYVALRTNLLRFALQTSDTRWTLSAIASKVRLIEYGK